MRVLVTGGAGFIGSRVVELVIEIGASAVVLWELTDTGESGRRPALRLIETGFLVLAGYLAVQSTLLPAAGYHPRHSRAGITWTAATAAVMFALAFGKAHTATALNNPVLPTEGRVTLVDALLATAALAGQLLTAGVGWWWADPAAGYVPVYHGTREGLGALRGAHTPRPRHRPRPAAPH